MDKPITEQLSFVALRLDMARCEFKAFSTLKAMAMFISSEHNTVSAINSLDNVYDFQSQLKRLDEMKISKETLGEISTATAEFRDSLHKVLKITFNNIYNHCIDLILIDMQKHQEAPEAAKIPDALLQFLASNFSIFIQDVKQEFRKLCQGNRYFIGKTNELVRELSHSIDSLKRFCNSDPSSSFSKILSNIENNLRKNKLQLKDQNEEGLVKELSTISMKVMGQYNKELFTVVADLERFVNICNKSVVADVKKLKNTLWPHLNEAAIDQNKLKTEVAKTRNGIGTFVENAGQSCDLLDDKAIREFEQKRDQHFSDLKKRGKDLWYTDPSHYTCEQLFLAKHAHKKFSMAAAEISDYCHAELEKLPDNDKANLRTLRYCFESVGEQYQEIKRAENQIRKLEWQLKSTKPDKDAPSLTETLFKIKADRQVRLEKVLKLYNDKIAPIVNTLSISALKIMGNAWAQDSVVLNGIGLLKIACPEFRDKLKVDQTHKDEPDVIVLN